MEHMHRNIIIAIIIILILLLAYWWWMKDTVKINITSISPASGSAGSKALTITGTTKSKSNPSVWVGRTIRIKTKSLGSMKSTIGSVSVASGVVSIVTAPITFAKSFTFTSSTTDHARIFLKL